MVPSARVCRIENNFAREKQSKYEGISQLWDTLAETLNLGFVRCCSSVEPRFRSSFLLPSSGEQDDTNRYLFF